MRSAVVLILMFLASSAVACTKTADAYQTQENLTIQELLELVDEWIIINPDLALEYALQAVSASREAGNFEGEIRALYKIGDIHYRSTDKTSSMPFYAEGLEKSQTMGNRLLTAEGHYHKGQYYERGSKFREAIVHLEQAKVLYKELDMPAEIAGIHNSYGRIYQHLGNYTESLNNFFRSLELNEELGNSLGMAIAYTNIGNTQMLNYNFDEAIHFMNESLKIDEANNDSTGILINKLNIGAAYERKGDYKTAMVYYHEALELARIRNIRSEEAKLLTNIGSTHSKMGNPKEGLPYLFEGLEIMREIDTVTPATLSNVAEAYLNLEQYPEALDYAIQSKEESKKNNDLNRLHYAYLNMANAYEGIGDLENAIRTLRLYNVTKDSLFTAEREKQINELQILYETEQRDQTITMLTLEAKTATFRRNTYLASGILVSMILLLLYTGQRYKTRKNRQLLEKSEEVAQMKSNFFSNISHEFRTPLTLISGPIEKLRSVTGDPGMRKELNIIQKNSDRLLSLINQLLDLSRLESGNLTLSVEKSDLQSLVKGVAMSFQSLAEMKNIDIHVHVENNFSGAWVDRSKLETILINLIGNALKFTREGGDVNVKLTVTNGKDGQKRCRIQVSDSGEGIADKDLEHIFDRFYRGSETEHSGSVGSGIGLALTKELVLLHKGEIRVHSSPGEGTEFIVEIPISMQHYSKLERIPASPAGTAPKPMITESELSPAQSPVISSDESAPLLLLIEDNRDVMNYLTGILKPLYRIITAEDGEKGVETALQEIPDLIISDVMMPKMNGYRVAEILKQDEKTSHIPLILLTAKASHEDRIQGLQTHADDYVTKPFRPDELLLRVENLILSRKKVREKYKRKVEIKPEELSVQSMEEAFLLRVVETIKKHLLNEDFSVDQLAREVGMSRSQLHRKLVGLTDLSATEFIRSYRLNLAREMIENQSGTISEIAYEVGFNSPSYFSKAFRKKFGVSPSEFEANNSPE